MKKGSFSDACSHFGKGETLLDQGDGIHIEKAGKKSRLLSAVRKPSHAGAPKPDFSARLKAIWGDRVFSAAEVRAMREAELEGEDG